MNVVMINGSPQAKGSGKKARYLGQRQWTRLTGQESSSDDNRKALVSVGLSIKGADTYDAADDISQWLDEIGLAE